MLLREPPDRERVIRRAHLAPWVVLIATLALSLIIGVAVHTLNEDRWQARFDTLVRDAAARVELRMAEYETVVRTARAFYAAAGPGAGSPDFLRGLEIDLRFGGVFDLEWAAAASEAGESPRIEAMHRARDDGQAAISAPFKVSGRTGFALFVPVYDATLVPATIDERRLALTGYVHATFRAAELFDGIFGVEGLAMPSLIVKVTDGDTVLYDAMAMADRATEPGLVSTTVVNVGGRNWTIESRAAAGFTSTADHYMGFGLAIVGIAISFVLFVLTRSQVAARHAAESLAAELSLRNRELDEFAYVASHDLKAPLRGIANLARWIEEDAGGELPPSVAGHLTMLQGRVIRLERLIDGILEYSRAGRAAHRRELVDCDTLVRETYALLNPPTATSLSVPLPLPRLNTCRTPLAQVYLNLLANAIKHAGPCCRIEVTARQLHHGWEMRIADDGPGIPPEYHEKVFGLFQTLQPRDRLESTGIGLAVVRKIVEQRGGKVWIASEARKGASICFVWQDA